MTRMFAPPDLNRHLRIKPHLCTLAITLAVCVQRKAQVSDYVQGLFTIDLLQVHAMDWTAWQRGQTP